MFSYFNLKFKQIGIEKLPYITTFNLKFNEEIQLYEFIVKKFKEKNAQFTESFLILKSLKAEKKRQSQGQ